MVIFLVGLVSMILMRTLRKDYARYSKEEEMDDMVRVHWLSSLLLTTLSSECKMTFLLFLSYINLICDFFFSFFMWHKTWHMCMDFPSDFFSLCCCTIRTETWEMNMGGSRYTVTFFGPQAIHWYSPRSSAPAARSSPCPSLSSSLLWLRICTQSE